MKDPALVNPVSHPDEPINEEIALLKEQLQSFRQEKAKVARLLWEEYEPMLLDRNHPLYERVSKIRDDFKLVAKGNTLSDEDVEHNLSALEPFRRIGFFRQAPTFDHTPPLTRSEKNKSINRSDAYLV